MFGHINPQNPNSQSTQTAVTPQQALANGDTLTGKISVSAPSSQTSGQFNVTAQVGQAQVSFVSSSPLPAGQNVTLSQNSQGQLLVQLAPTANAANGTLSLSGQSTPINTQASVASLTSTSLLSVTAEVLTAQAPKINQANTPAQVIASTTANTAGAHTTQSTAATSLQNTSQVQTDAAVTTKTTHAQQHIAAATQQTSTYGRPIATNTHVNTQTTSSASSQTHSPTNLQTNSQTNLQAKFENTSNPPARTGFSISPAPSQSTSQTTHNTGPSTTQAQPSGANSTGAQAKGASPLTNGLNPAPSGQSNTGSNINKAASTAHGANNTHATQSTLPTTNSGSSLTNPSGATTSAQTGTQSVGTHLATLTTNTAQTLTVATPVPLTVGTHVLVSPTDASPNKVVISVPQQPQNHGVQNERITPQERQLIDVKAKNSLPVQQPTAQVLSQLSTLSSTLSANPPLQGAVNSILQLFGVSPGAANAPETIRNNLVSGGQQMPANIGRSGQLSTSELPTALSKLQTMAKQLPEGPRAQMEALIQQSLARISHQQTQALNIQADLPDAMADTKVLHTDIPVWQGKVLDNVDVWISKESGEPGLSDDHELSEQWRVFLHFALDEAGPLDVELRLTNKDTAEVKFWAKDATLLSRLNNERLGFIERLESIGLAEVSVSQFHGDGPRPAQQVSKHALVDTHS